MNGLAVTDSLSNRNEHIEELAKLIGNGRKRQLFVLIYSSQKRSWTVSEIANAMGITPKNASALAIALFAGGALHQDKAGSRVSYRKVPAHKHIKDKVLKLSGDKKAIESIPTKRRPVIAGRLFTSVKTVARKAVTRASSVPVTVVARVAFLMASPGGVGAINVGLDYREALKAVQASKGRDKLDLRPFPAADVDALLDAINEYRPDVVQFSGHGSSTLVLLDGEVRSSGGTVLDFSVAKQMLAATSTPPKCVVLAACQTAKGASILLDAVPIVIAMSDDISDPAAAFFCKRFYAAIAAGQSIGAAFSQAKAFLVAEKLPDANLPTLLVMPGSGAENLVLVK